MYYSGVHDQRAYQSYNNYSSYNSSFNDSRPALYSNNGYNYTDSYPSYTEAPYYSRDQRGPYEPRSQQLDTINQQDKGYNLAYARPYNGYSNINSQYSQSYYNEYDYKSLSSEITTRNDIPENGGDKYFPPCALQYYETDIDSNEDDELMEQRNSCAYAKTITRNSNLFNNDRGRLVSLL